jgi:hypothetical protein
MVVMYGTYISSFYSSYAQHLSNASAACCHDLTDLEKAPLIRLYIC